MDGWMARWTMGRWMDRWCMDDGETNAGLIICGDNNNEVITNNMGEVSMTARALGWDLRA